MARLGAAAADVDRTDDRAAERLMNAIVLRTVGMNLAQVFGAGLAGLLIAVVDFEGAFVAQAACYGVAGTCYRLVRLPMTLPLGDRRPRMLDAGGRGTCGLSLSNRALRGLVFISVVTGLFMLGPTFVLVPEIARTKLEVGSTLNGMLMAFTGLGMFVMSLYLASRQSLNRKGYWFMLNMFLCGPIVWVSGCRRLRADGGLHVRVGHRRRRVHQHEPDAGAAEYAGRHDGPGDEHLHALDRRAGAARVAARRGNGGSNWAGLVHGPVDGLSRMTPQHVNAGRSTHAP
jgi:hypothetical protein